ncbi:hypothetical protein ElyMa_001032200 [Elysia marginata]|uniref:Uncharacterized protein n=1 Tax=Elysia marginata TaxID=1093978 RepID=A0AAV4HPD6_9GAST|nr:hypothetical protein ElyMa_001032200 [Elysia marginata]
MSPLRSLMLLHMPGKIHTRGSVDVMYRSEVETTKDFASKDLERQSQNFDCLQRTMEFPVVVLLVLLATLTPMTSAAIEALSDSDRDYVLEKHNSYRADEPAANMPNLVSSEILV